MAHVSGLQGQEGGIVVANARHVEALTEAREALLSAERRVEQAISGELLATDLSEAQHHLGAITGRIAVEDLPDSIFLRSCIGE